jgi:hypothetical protein
VCEAGPGPLVYEMLALSEDHRALIFHRPPAHTVPPAYAPCMTAEDRCSCNSPSAFRSSCHRRVLSRRQPSPPASLLHPTVSWPECRAATAVKGPPLPASSAVDLAMGLPDPAVARAAAQAHTSSGPAACSTRTATQPRGSTGSPPSSTGPACSAATASQRSPARCNAGGWPSGTPGPHAGCTARAAVCGSRTAERRGKASGRTESRPDWLVCMGPMASMPQTRGSSRSGRPVAHRAVVCRLGSCEHEGQRCVPGHLKRGRVRSTRAQGPQQLCATACPAVAAPGAAGGCTGGGAPSSPRLLPAPHPDTAGTGLAWLLLASAP